MPALLNRQLYTSSTAGISPTPKVPLSPFGNFSSAIEPDLELINHQLQCGVRAQCFAQHPSSFSSDCIALKAAPIKYTQIVTATARAKASAHVIIVSYHITPH